MFGVTIVGCFVFRAILSSLNKKLEEGELAWDSRPDATEHAAEVDIMDSPDEALRMKKGFRYLV